MRACVGALQAAGHVSSLIPGGASVNRTDRNCTGLRQPFDKFPRNLQLVPLVNLGLGGNIENQPRCVTLIEQLQPSCWTPVGFPGENNHRRLTCGVDSPPEIARKSLTKAITNNPPKMRTSLSFAMDPFSAAKSRPQLLSAALFGPYRLREISIRSLSKL